MPHSLTVPFFYSLTERVNQSASPLSYCQMKQVTPSRPTQGLIAHVRTGLRGKRVSSDPLGSFCIYILRFEGLGISSR